ncbi:helix-turn-helix domain-containing protein [Caloranaerobacter sp. DY30410]|uniref:helix-turn-helix domain-containing protein n=1 Tax=Caloranaerobacter sp. DY30410 TaxID=3238305 RepID=UPI003CFCE45C
MFNRNRIIKILEKKGWSKYRLAKKAGIAHSTLHDILTGKNANPNTRTLEKLAEALGVSINEFFDEMSESKLATQKNKIHSENNTEIGKRIKKLRKEKGLTQKELAEKSNLSRSYLADLERDRYNPSLDSLKQIANALGVHVSILLDEKQAKFIESLKLDTPEEALKFILQQPVLMAYGGYDLNNMSEEEIMELANDMLLAMKLSLEKKKRRQ